jgi:hypothetical protein
MEAQLSNGQLILPETASKGQEDRDTEPKAVSGTGTGADGGERGAGEGGAEGTFGAKVADANAVKGENTEKVEMREK